MTMDIVGHRNIFYIISGALLLGALVAVLVFGLRLGVDFTGGSLVEVSFAPARPPVADLAGRLTPMFGAVRLQPTGERGLILRLRHLSEAEHQELLRVLGPAGSGIIEKRFDTVGPTIGGELRRKSILAIAIVMLLIVSYITWAFRTVSAPAAPGRSAGLASWKYGVTTVIALLHDVLIPTGFFAVAGRLYGFEVETLFVTAIFTILGLSVHDTIVVFDSIRENLKKSRSPGDFGALVNASVRETLVRSINTSLTVALAMVAVYLLGGATTKIFSLTLVIGVIAGTYSSIFIASPLLVTWYERQGGRA